MSNGFEFWVAQMPPAIFVALRGRLVILDENIVGIHRSRRHLRIVFNGDDEIMVGIGLLPDVPPRLTVLDEFGSTGFALIREMRARQSSRGQGAWITDRPLSSAGEKVRAIAMLLLPGAGVALIVVGLLRLMLR